jgi:hypothetical protein
MKKQLPSSSVERWLTSATSTHLFLLAFFGAGILAFAVGFSHRPGPDVISYPLFTWSPFLLVLGLQMLLQGLRDVRDAGLSLKAMIWPARWPILVAVCCFALGGYLHAVWPLVVGAQQLSQGGIKIRQTSGPVATKFCDSLMPILGAIGLFVVALSLHSVISVRG